MSNTSVLAPKSQVVTSPQHEDEAQPRLTTASLREENQRHDWLIALFVVILGVLLGAFPINNSDVWLQLRTGQLIAGGEFAFGQDPYAYTSSGAWVHVAWLWDWLAYQLYSLGEGPALVLLRCGIMLAITLLLLKMRRREGSLFVAAFCTSLAIVVLSARLRFRSELVSFLFLAITTYLLYRPAQASGAGFLDKFFAWTHGRAWVLLPPLFALWANLDYWFWLGPATVALYWLGATLQGAASDQRYGATGLTPAERKSLLITLGVGLLACLLNPNHFHVFQLPGELYSDALRQIAARPGNERLNVSPWNFQVYFGPTRPEATWFRPKGLSLAEWAYYPLVLLGIFSFIWRLRSLNVSRLLLWTGFFALSVWQVRNVGFFAIVAGPITTLNLQEWLLERERRDAPVSKWGLAVAQIPRLLWLGVLVLTCLLVLRVDHLIDPQRPWLPADRTDGLVHRLSGFGLGMRVDPSLESVATQLSLWRDRLPGKPFFYDWQEMPTYAAWFDPGSQHFLDIRFAVHGDAVRDYHDVMRALQETGVGPPEQRDERIRQIFEKYDVSHVVLGYQARVLRDDPLTGQRGVLDSLVDVLLDDRDRRGQPKWIPLGYVDGRNFILGWAGSRHRADLEKLRYLSDQQAYQQPRTRPPADGPDLLAKHSRFRAWLEGEAVVLPVDVDAANWHAGQAELHLLNARRQSLRSVLLPLAMGPGAALVGVPMPIAPFLESTTGAEHWLSIRAARQAIAASYDQPNPYARRIRGTANAQLHQYYTALYQMERELAPNNVLRDLQILSSLRQAALSFQDESMFTLDRPYVALELELAVNYIRKGYNDLAVKHYERALNWGASRGFTRERFETEELSRHPQPYVRQLPQVMKEVESNKRSQTNRYVAAAALNPDAAQRAQLAMQLKLVDEARLAMEKVLAESNRDPRNPHAARAMAQLVVLYLDVGYLPEAKALLQRRDALVRLGAYSYHEYSALVAGALGEYEQAFEQRLLVDELMQKEAIDRGLTATQLQLIGGISETPGSGSAGVNLWYEGVGIATRRAEQWCQMGQLALEAGWTQSGQGPGGKARLDAAACFEKAINDVNHQSAVRPLASRYHRLITGQWLE